MVVVHHANGNLYPFGGPFFAYFNGSTGVDLFFVISGFVITLSIQPILTAADRDSGRWREIFAFWTRRAFRLLPSAWFWLVAILLLQVFYNDSAVFGSLQANLMATLFGVLQIANVRFADAFMSYEYGVSFYYWSLSLEEQFYLALPLLAVFSRRALPLILLSVAAYQLLQPRTLYGMAFRTDALCLGVLLAMAKWGIRMPRISPPAILNFAPVATLLAIASFALLAMANAKAVQLSPLPMSLVTVGALGLVFVATLDAGHIRRLVLLPALVRWLGERSYAIYLIHVPAFFFARETLSRLDIQSPGPAPLILTATLVIALAAEANFRFIETPLRNRGRRAANEIASHGRWRHRSSTELLPP